MRAGLTRRRDASTYELSRMSNGREGILEPIPHSVIRSARDSRGKRQLLCSLRSSSQAWTPRGKQCSHIPALAGQMLPSMSPNGLASQSFWAVTSVGDAHSQAFHLGDKPGFRGKNVYAYLIQRLQHLACLDLPRCMCFLQAGRILITISTENRQHRQLWTHPPM